MACTWKSTEQTRQAQDVAAIPTLAWSARPDGSVEFLNRRWLDYTGLSAEEASNCNTAHMLLHLATAATLIVLLMKRTRQSVHDRSSRLVGKYLASNYAYYSAEEEVVTKIRDRFAKPPGMGRSDHFEIALIV
jgi:PAS domain-containing protein